MEPKRRKEISPETFESLQAMGYLTGPERAFKDSLSVPEATQESEAVKHDLRRDRAWKRGEYGFDPEEPLDEVAAATYRKRKRLPTAEDQAAAIKKGAR